jgi:hypothetical protein
MKKILSIYFLLLSIPLIYSQKHMGFYGSRAFVQIDGLANYPVFSNIFSLENTTDSYFTYNGSDLVPSRDRFNAGYRINLGYALERNFAILLELGQDYSNVGLDQGSIYNEVNSNEIFIPRHEKLSIRTVSIVPKFEFATSKALLPMGLGHQFGLGLAYSSVVEKNYAYERISYKFGIEERRIVNYNDVSTDIDPINFEQTKQIRKVVFLYALNMRTPLTKKLLLTYGVRYTLNIGKDNLLIYTNSQTNPNNSFSYNAKQSILRHRTYSFINANIGLCYTF